MNTVSFLDQVIAPSKIVCIGRNYVEHIHELGNEVPDDMVVFVKPNSAISKELRTQHDPIHYEAELCFLVENGQFIAVGIGLDLTKRDLQSKLKLKGLPWERAKGFDGSVVFSDFIPLTDAINQLSFELKINDSTTQQGNIGLMMYKPDIIKTEIQKFMSLVDGDIVMTGTPKGVGKVNQGDIFEARVLSEGNALVYQKWAAQ
jgi:2-keto-4-pentenoate hydratase/2-oxohepta-3-ene-1,7-dioic acid hydratase in catechol pathway